jgi:methoxymalonate biosynthesis acyl carrier protein
LTVTTPSQIRASLRLFLANYVRSPDFGDSEDIFKSGYVNSLFAMQLVLHVENTFGIAVGNEDMDIANFNSVDALTRFVGSKLGTDVAA